MYIFPFISVIFLKGVEIKVCAQSSVLISHSLIFAIIMYKVKIFCYYKSIKFLLWKLRKHI